MGPMTGGGRGFCSPRGIGAARTYGFPRWAGYAYPYYGAEPFFTDMAPFTPRMSREQEIDFLKSAAQALKKTLEGIDGRIRELTGEGK